MEHLIRYFIKVIFMCLPPILLSKLLTCSMSIYIYKYIDVSKVQWHGDRAWCMLCLNYTDGAFSCLEVNMIGFCFRSHYRHINKYIILTNKIWLYMYISNTHCTVSLYQILCYNISYVIDAHVIILHQFNYAISNCCFN